MKLNYRDIAGSIDEAFVALWKLYLKIDARKVDNDPAAVAILQALDDAISAVELAGEKADELFEKIEWRE